MILDPKARPENVTGAEYREWLEVRTSYLADLAEKWRRAEKYNRASWSKRKAVLCFGNGSCSYIMIDRELPFTDARFHELDAILPGWRD